MRQHTTIAVFGLRRSAFHASMESHSRGSKSMKGPSDPAVDADGNVTWRYRTRLLKSVWAERTRVSGRLPGYGSPDLSSCALARYV